MSAGTLRSPSPDAAWEPSYIALLWLRRSWEPQLVQKLRARVALERPDLKLVIDQPGLIIFADPADCGMGVLKDDAERLTVLGSAFDAQGVPLQAEALQGAPAEAARAADWLFTRYWGSYLAVAIEPDNQAFIARDPSGGLAANVIDAGGVALLTDHVPSWLADVVGRALTVNRTMLANALAMPLLTTHKSLVRNVALIPAGGVVGWDGKPSECRVCWHPSMTWSGGSYDPERMRESVLVAVRALRAVHSRLLIELSGGLDSAIVLGALRAAGEFEHLAAVNLATTYSGGDERELARAAAKRCDVELVEFIARDTELDYTATLQGPQPLQPNLYGLDPLLEASVARTAAMFGSDAILTGQGGDAVFFQVPTEKIAIDFMLHSGKRSWLSQHIFDAARRTRRSVWSVHAAMARHCLVGTRPDRMPVSTGLLSSKARDLIEPALGEHPWLHDTGDLPPAKQTQILTVANCQLFNGPTRRAQVASLRHPLMTQPVVEAWLAAPSFVLSSGTQDRAFARSIFADLIPPAIARRRGKGETSIYYRRSLVENLTFLRSHLLEGTLVGHGLVDPDKLNALLDEEVLLWSDEARLLPSLASFESWARYWRL